MASPGEGGGGSARRSREEDEDGYSSALSKKPRPSNRRVSFGPNHIRTFESSEPFISGNNNDSSPDDIPARRGLIFDDDGQDTLPRIDNPPLTDPPNNDQSPLMDSKHSTPTTSFMMTPMDSMDLQNTSPRHNGIPVFEEDFNPNLEPRFSMMMPHLDADDENTIFDRDSLGGQSLGDHLVNRRQSIAPFGSQSRPSIAGPFSSIDEQQNQPSVPSNDLENRTASHRPSINKPPLPRNTTNSISINLRPINASEPRASAPNPRQMVRPSLPANRQLFTNDEMEDTIHDYSHVKQQPKSILKASSQDSLPILPPSDATPAAKKSPLLNSATKTLDHYDRTPPQSELASKIRSAALERSALRNTANRSFTTEHSIQDEPSLALDTPHEASFPLVSKFIGDVGLSIPFERNFAGNILMVDEKPDIEEINLDNKHGRVFAGYMNKIVIKNIDATIEQVQDDVTEVERNLKELSLKLEENPPEIITQFAKAGSLSAESRIVVQSGLARLRRYMDLEASHDWRNFKKKLNEKKKAGFQEAIHELEIGEAEDKKWNESLGGYLEKFENDIENLEFHIPINENHLNVACAPVDQVICEELLTNFESRGTQSRRSQVEKNKQEVLRKKLDEVRREIEKLEKECEKSRQRIADGPELNHRKEMEMLKREHAERIKRSGIDTRKASNKELVIRIANIADVTVKLEKSKITSLDVNAVALESVLPGPMEAFVNDSITMVSSCINNCTKVEQLPLVLDLMKKHLEQVKKAGLESAKYIDQHDMEWKESVEEKESVYSPFRLMPRYFNSEKHLRFGVLLLLKYFPPVFDGDSDLKEEGSCEIAVERVVEIIGEAPAEKDIEKKLKKTDGSICDKMGALWGFCS